MYRAPIVLIVLWAFALVACGGAPAPTPPADAPASQPAAGSQPAQAAPAPDTPAPDTPTPETPPASTEPASEAPPSVGPALGQLPEIARALLRQRMARHGAALAKLSHHITELEFDGVGQVAGEIAGEPMIARPTGNEAPDDLNAQLPSNFFTWQERLRSRADHLARAAGTQDAAATRVAYDAVTSTCAGCHEDFAGR